MMKNNKMNIDINENENVKISKDKIKFQSTIDTNIFIVSREILKENAFVYFLFNTQ